MTYTVLEKDAISFDREWTLEKGQQVEVRPHDNPMLVKVYVNRWLVEEPDMENQNWYMLPTSFDKVWKAFLKDDIYESSTKE